MFPTPPRGDETSADVYRLLSTIHGQLEGFERKTVLGNLETRLHDVQNRLQRLEAQLHRIEGQVNQIAQRR